jgi:predicted Zn-dependent protease
LAVIVAHELAHSVLAHRRRLAAAGVSKGLLAEFGRNGRLNRQVEREADRLSVHLLRNAGYDPQLAPTFWDKRGRQLGSSGIHDSPKQRARLMRDEIATIPSDAPRPFLPPMLTLRDQPLK